MLKADENDSSAFESFNHYDISKSEYGKKKVHELVILKCGWAQYCLVPSSGSLLCFMLVLL